MFCIDGYDLLGRKIDSQESNKISMDNAQSRPLKIGSILFWSVCLAVYNRTEPKMVCVQFIYTVCMCQLQLVSSLFPLSNINISLLFSMTFSKVFKIFLEFFECCLKIENDVII